MVNILAFLKTKGIMHRDLKPGNLLFNDQWHLVLADFGTAKEVKQDGSASPISSSTMSPKPNSSSFSSFSSAMLSRLSSANNLLKSPDCTSSEAIDR